MRSIFTTGQAAKICKVAPRTICKWFDSGRLTGYRVPGSQDRRITRENLIRFLKEHGMPHQELLLNVLLVGTADEVTINLMAIMDPMTFAITSVKEGFEAGIEAKSLRPICVVIDFSAREKAVFIAQNIRQDPVSATIPIIGLAIDDGAYTDYQLSFFTEIFRRPFDCALLAERIKSLTDQRQKTRKSSVSTA